MNRHSLLMSTISLSLMCAIATADTHKALIIDGQNNHEMWPKTTFMMKKYLEDTGLFTVDIARTKYTWKGDALLEEYSLPGVTTQALSEPRPDPSFRPDFSQYDVVVSNFGFNAAPWPSQTQRDLEAFVRGGGGLVIVHAANNSFGDWEEFNRMIGLGAGAAEPNSMVRMSTTTVREN